MIETDMNSKKNRQITVNTFLQLLFNFEKDGVNVNLIINELRLKGTLKINGRQYLLSRDEVNEVLSQAKGRWVN